jgi:hypothetical protein
MELTAELTLYLLGILALLGLWLFHQFQVRSGRIQAIDVFDRSVARFYLYVIPNDRPFCAACAQAQGRVFLPGHVGKIGFSPLNSPCSGSVPCQGQMIGLYGGWLEARQLVTRLQQASRKNPVRLTSAEILALAKGAWSKSVSADTDRISMHLLEGWCFGQTEPAVAIEGLRYVIDRAKEERHLPYVVPAFLRLMDLLLRAGRDDEARVVIEQFEARFPSDRHDVDGPSFTQRKVLQQMKSLLWETRSLKVSA